MLVGQHGFTAEELEFVINYDLKCRPGRANETWKLKVNSLSLTFQLFEPVLHQRAIFPVFVIPKIR